MAQVTEIRRLADRHGFKLAGYRSFERAVTEEQIAGDAARGGAQGGRAPPPERRSPLPEMSS